MAVGSSDPKPLPTTTVALLDLLALHHVGVLVPALLRGDRDWDGLGGVHEVVVPPTGKLSLSGRVGYRVNTQHSTKNIDHSVWCCVYFI